MQTSSIQSEDFQNALLAWFAARGRDLPWRKEGRRDPYLVWLAEIMLQQTTVAAVIPYYRKFIKAFPAIQTLAEAPLDEVLKLWAGLGYYSRARNLHKCAKIVTEKFSGQIPPAEKDLLALPGIGPYTAAAIAALAFDQRAVVVDGNIERVISRLFKIETPLPKSKPRLLKLAGEMTPKSRPGDYAEAMMDLGATVCTPKTPKCDHCPVVSFCAARAEGVEEGLPRRAAKKPRPTRFGTVFWLENDGKVLTRRRPEKGLLGGMPEFPTTPWADEPGDFLDHQPAAVPWRKLDGRVTHTFTHFHLVLEVFEGKGRGGPGEWVKTKDVLEMGLPSVMKKVARKVLREP